MRKLSILLILIIATLLAVTTPVAAVTLHIDLGKTYKAHLMNISFIDAIDIWDLSQTQSQVLTTAGDSSDIQTLHNPTFNHLVENFTPAIGTSVHTTITVTGSPETVEWTTLPAYSFYTQPKVPTIRQAIPGKTGNPLISQYNASWVTGSGSDSGLFFASNGIDMYKAGGILDINTTNNVYTNIGSFSADDYNTTNFPYTLTRNQLAVDAFSSDASQANLLGNAHPEIRANTGSYFLSTVQHDEPAATTNVYSVYRVVALKAPTPLTWKNTSFYTADEYTYFKGSNQNVVLNFTGTIASTNPDIPNIKNITYLIVNRTASYNIVMHVDTNQLAENAESQWQNSLSGGQVIDILYATLANDVTLPFTYAMNASGVATVPSTTFSNIAITPGYGISGNARATDVTVPSAALESLITGYYDIYLMGTDSKNNVVALDQKTVRVVQKSAPTVTGITPAFGKRGTTVQVSNLAGTQFAAGATVQLINGTTTINATNVTVVSPTKITCTFQIPATMARVGVYNVKVTNLDGQAGTKLKAFTVMTPVAPTVTSITPASGRRGTTVTITNLAGTQFAAGATVQLINGTTTITATNVVVVSATRITCTFTIPATMARVGVYNVKVTNQDGQAGTKLKAFTVRTFAVPTVTSITPASGRRGTTVTITNLVGTQFAGGARVQLINGTTTLTATNVVVVSATRISCKVAIPATAKVGVWNVRVINQDGLVATKLKAFTVKTVSPPTVTSITPATHARNNVAFSANLAGTQFANGAKVQLTRTGATTITATSVVVAGTGNSLTCSFKIPVTALKGLYTVKVTNQDSQVATKTNAFTVTPV